MKKQKAQMAKKNFASPIQALQRRRMAWYMILGFGLVFIQAAYALHGGQAMAMPSGHPSWSGFAAVAVGDAPWSVYASLGLAATAAVGFFATHLELLRHGWYKGRHFMAVHPVLDIAVVILIILLLIYTAAGLAQ